MAVNVVLFPVSGSLRSLCTKLVPIFKVRQDVLKETLLHTILSFGAVLGALQRGLTTDLVIGAVTSKPFRKTVCFVSVLSPSVLP